MECPLAGRTVVDRTWVALDVFDELRERRHAERGMHAQREVGRPQHGDGRKAVDDVERHRGIHQRQRQRGIGTEGDGMAVGRGLGDRGQADDAGSPRLVLDHEGAARLLRQPGRKKPCAQVGRGPRGEGHDDLDGLVRQPQRVLGGRQAPWRERAGGQRGDECPALRTRYEILHGGLLSFPGDAARAQATGSRWPAARWRSWTN